MLISRYIPSIKYDNKDISEELLPFIKSISYTDPLSGEADSVDITLMDKDGRWRSDWFPDKGATLDIEMFTREGDNIKSMRLGVFEIDELESKGPPSEVIIKAVSVPENSQLRGVEKSKSWEKVKLSEIAQEIANNAGVKLYYDTAENPTLDRVEQSDESDLSFLVKICKDHALAVKVSDNNLVIFDEIKFEQQDSTAFIYGLQYPTPFTINGPAFPVADDPRMPIIEVGSYSFKSKTRDIYAACHVKYQHSQKGRLIEYTFRVPDKPGKVLEINEQVDSIAAAEKLAKKRLREKNAEEDTGNFKVKGDFSLYAGLTLDVLNYGHFDGKYIAKSVTHEWGTQYTCSIDIRRCLNGY